MDVLHSVSAVNYFPGHCSTFSNQHRPSLQQKQEFSIVCVKFTVEKGNVLKKVMNKKTVYKGVDKIQGLQQEVVTTSLGLVIAGASKGEGGSLGGSPGES